MSEQKQITGQVIYVGPQLPHLGLQYGSLFKNGIHPHLYSAIEKCPAIGALFVPIPELAAARKQLNFDIAHTMRGTEGVYPNLYREVQQWLTTQTKETKTSPITIKEQHHA